MGVSVSGDVQPTVAEDGADDFEGYPLPMKATRACVPGILEALVAEA